MEPTEIPKPTVNAQILIAVEKPKKKPSGSVSGGKVEFLEADEWLRFCSKIGVPALGSQEVQNNPKINDQRLADNLWLLTLNSDLPLVGKICQAAKEERLPCKWAILDDKPNWVFQDWRNPAA